MDYSHHSFSFESMYYLILFLSSLYFFLLQYSALVLFCIQILPHNHSSIFLFIHKFSALVTPFTLFLPLSHSSCVLLLLSSPIWPIYMARIPAKGLWELQWRGFLLFILMPSAAESSSAPTGLDWCHTWGIWLPSS